MKFMQLKESKIVFPLIILAGFVLAYTIALFFSRAFTAGDRSISGLFFGLRSWPAGREIVSPYLRMVSIDEQDCELLDIKKDDRAIFGQMINIISAARPAVIVVDIIFKDNPGAAGNQELVDYTKKAGNVFYPVSLSGENLKGLSRDTHLKVIREKTKLGIRILHQGKPPSRYLIKSYPFNDLSMAAKGLGDISLEPDPDNHVMRIPLVSAFEGDFIPSLVLISICYFFKIDPGNIEIQFGKYIRFINAELPDGTARDFMVPIDNEGRMLINFIAPAEIQKSILPGWKLFSDFNDNDSREKLLFKLLDSFVIVSENIKNDANSFKGVFNEIYPHSLILYNSINTILTRNFLYIPGSVERIFPAVLAFLWLWFAAVKWPLKKLFAAAFFLVILLTGINFILFLCFNRLPFLLAHLAAVVLSLLLTGVYKQALSLKTAAQAAPGTETWTGTPVLPQPPLSSSNNENMEIEFQKYAAVRKYKEIIALLLKGYEYKEIGAELNLKLNTVKKKIQKLYKACGVQNKIELFNFFGKK